MELSDAICSRRSYRKFKPDPVPRALLEELVQTSLWAPSAMNTQPWRFYILTGEKKDGLIDVASRCLGELDKRLNSLFADKMKKIVHGFFRDMGGAPVVVVVTTAVPDMDGYLLGSYESSTAAFYNFLLLAHEAGLGTCWMTGPLWVENEILAYLGCENQRMVAMTPLGYPDQSVPVPPRKHQDIVWME